MKAANGHTNLFDAGAEHEASSRVDATDTPASPEQPPIDHADGFFDWRKDASVICAEQPATALYENSRGQIVIRQEARWDEEWDTVVFLNQEGAAVLIGLLADKLKFSGLAKEHLKRLIAELQRSEREVEAVN